jgi:stage V sporulation protein G
MGKKAAEKEKEKETSSAFDCLAVTQVQVFPFTEGPSMGHLLGLAAIVLNDQFQIRGLRIMEGAVENGLYVGYPNDPFYKGEDCRSVCCPITRQLREHIEKVVIDKYKESLDPREWSVKFGFGQSDEHSNDQESMVIAIKVTECTRADAIEKAKSVLSEKCGSDLADKMEVLCAK